MKDGMTNKDKRSLALSLVLGDGCLHYIKTKSGLYGGITIAHSEDQADYLSWKTALLNKTLNKNAKMRPFKRVGGYPGAKKAFQASVCMKRMRAWRKFCYPGGKKSMSRLLRFIRHPEFAISVWLMDDGYVEPTIQNEKLYGAAFRLFACDQSPEEHAQIVSWFEINFKVTPKVYWQRTAGKKPTPYLRFNVIDSLTLWTKIREFVLQFKSMQHKFRYMEERFLYKVSQPAPGKNVG